jgi:GxxExxY protein
MELEFKELTEKIIGAAIEVHRRLGPGFIESIYERALVIELQKRGITVQKQLPIVIEYDGIEVGKHRLDLVVEESIVVELKTVKELADVHFAVVKSYLRASHRRHGLLLNFAQATLEVSE